jgi:propionyl-CoA synthetase
VVFGGFASDQLAQRIDHALPKVVISASCGFAGMKPIAYKPLLDAAIDIAKHKPKHCIIYNVLVLSLVNEKLPLTYCQRDPIRCELIPGRDLDWNSITSKSKPATFVPVESQHPLYIIYTSGTTGTSFFKI